MQLDVPLLAEDRVILVWNLLQLGCVQEEMLLCHLYRNPANPLVK